MSGKRVLWTGIEGIPSHVRLVAITKGRSLPEIEALIQQGQVWFGENRLQEIAQKWPVLKARYSHVKLQFMGQLQTNKVEKVLSLCDSVVSVDRPSLVEALVHIRAGEAFRKKPIEFLVQVNLAHEPQKGGIFPENLESLLQKCVEEGLPIAGLMAIPPQASDPLLYFQKLRHLVDMYGFQECSMGMSDDYATAITCGATQVRIGRLLFAHIPKD